MAVQTALFSVMSVNDMQNSDTPCPFIGFYLLEIYWQKRLRTGENSVKSVSYVTSDFLLVILFSCSFPFYLMTAGSEVSRVFHLMFFTPVK